jgi:hypothetical protein
MNGDKGQITVLASAVGAVLSGTPIIAYAYDSQSGSELAFYVALMVSLVTIGAGVGKVYSLWKRAVISSAERDAKILELCERLEVMEKRQIEIQTEVRRQVELILKNSDIALGNNR